MRAALPLLCHGGNQPSLLEPQCFHWKNMDAVLVLNFNKNGQENYIGGATFLEIYDAFRMNKKIYFVNDIPNNMLKDELIGFNPTIVGEDLRKII